jgi:hypothetical protein
MRFARPGRSCRGNADAQGGGDLGWTGSACAAGLGEGLLQKCIGQWYRWPPCRHDTRHAVPCRRARPCYGPGLQPMTRHMGCLPVLCHPWATVHVCELGGRPWKERERAGCGRRGDEARCGRAGTVPPCRVKAVSWARPAAHDPHGPSYTYSQWEAGGRLSVNCSHLSP